MLGTINNGMGISPHHITITPPGETDFERYRIHCLKRGNPRTIRPQTNTTTQIGQKVLPVKWVA